MPHDGLFFFFNDTATTEIYTLSLHDALPIWVTRDEEKLGLNSSVTNDIVVEGAHVERDRLLRSEEHTSELQSLAYLVCRLLLEKKKRSQPHHPLLSLDTLPHSHVMPRRVPPT